MVEKHWVLVPPIEAANSVQEPVIVRQFLGRYSSVPDVYDVSSKPPRYDQPTGVLINLVKRS
jgi:hypothetical protein